MLAKIEKVEVSEYELVRVSSCVHAFINSLWLWFFFVFLFLIINQRKLNRMTEKVGKQRNKQINTIGVKHTQAYNLHGFWHRRDL